MPENNFTEQSREQIIHSLTNNSKSKQAWTFARQKRFPNKTPNCPYIAYQTQLSTISKIKPSFGTSRRKVFTQASEAPSPWIYHPQDQDKNCTISFAQGRDDILINSYIDKQIIKNPGPGKYNYQNKDRRGYSMRPKTANNRTYNKEQSQNPGPGNYQEDTVKVIGKNFNSKFKSSVSGVITKEKRFFNMKERTPSVWDYKKNNFFKPKGGKMGKQFRKAFTDKIANNLRTPGPGNYKLPTQFGHYKKINFHL